MNNLEITTADAVEEKAVVESVEFAEPNFFEKAKFFEAEQQKRELVDIQF